MTPADIAAELDELEAAALAATAGPWRVEGHVIEGAGTVAFDKHMLANDATHIALNDPAATLRTVKAQRAILALHSELREFVALGRPETRQVGCNVCSTGWADADFDGPSPASWPCETIELLASQWDDVPADRGVGA